MSSLFPSISTLVIYQTKQPSTAAQPGCLVCPDALLCGCTSLHGLLLTSSKNNYRVHPGDATEEIAFDVWRSQLVKAVRIYSGQAAPRHQSNRPDPLNELVPVTPFLFRLRKRLSRAPHRLVRDLSSPLFVLTLPSVLGFRRAVLPHSTGFTERPPYPFIL